MFELDKIDRNYRRLQVIEHFDFVSLTSIEVLLEIN